MKKYPKYQLRVSEEMMAALVSAGPDVVRGWLETGFASGRLLSAKSSVVVMQEGVVGPAAVSTTGVSIPAWKAKLEQQLAEKEAREASSSLSGSAAPAAVASVSSPRSVVFQQSEAERAKKMALARSAATGMKMQPQMTKPADFHPDDEPQEP